MWSRTAVSGALGKDTTENSTIYTCAGLESRFEEHCSSRQAARHSTLSTLSNAAGPLPSGAPGRNYLISRSSWLSSKLDGMVVDLLEDCSICYCEFQPYEPWSHSGRLVYGYDYPWMDTSCPVLFHYFILPRWDGVQSVDHSPLLPLFVQDPI